MKKHLSLLFAGVVALTLPLHTHAQDSGDVDTEPSADATSEGVADIRRERIQRNATDLRDLFGVDLLGALDSSADPAYRMRQIDDIGRYGNKELVPDLATLIDDENVDVRVSVFRSIMRLGPDRVMPQLSSVLSKEDATPRDVAWAVRAMGRSENPKEALPKLISALQHQSSQVRAATIDSMRNLTGVSLGASPKLLLPWKEAQRDIDAFSKQWQDWWQENQERTPLEWRTTALKSQTPKQVASAARSIKNNRELEAMPELLAAFKRLGSEGGTSGPRAAVAEALEELTGRRLNYQAYQGDMSLEEWQRQHDEAYEAWRTTGEQMLKPDHDRALVLLEAPEPKTRLYALDDLSKRTLSEQPLDEYVKLLFDPARGVAVAAHLNLVAATGVHFPFDEMNARSEKQALQQAIHAQRWRDWVATYGGSLADRARGLAVFFQEPEKMPDWGVSVIEQSTLDSEVLDEVWEEDQKSLQARSPMLRAKAARFIAEHKLPVSRIVLIDAFEEELATAEEALKDARSLKQQPYAMLQIELAKAISVLEIDEGVDLIGRRLEVSHRAFVMRESLEALGEKGRVVAAALDNDDVNAACLRALASYGLNAVSQVSRVKVFLSSGWLLRERVSHEAAIALGQLGNTQDLKLLEDLLELGRTKQLPITRAEVKVYDQAPHFRIGVVAGMYALAVRLPEIRDRVAKLLLQQVLENTYETNEKRTAYRYPRKVRAVARRAHRVLSGLVAEELRNADNE